MERRRHGRGVGWMGVHASPCLQVDGGMAGGSVDGRVNGWRDGCGSRCLPCPCLTGSFMGDLESNSSASTLLGSLWLLDEPELMAGRPAPAGLPSWPLLG